MTTPKSTALIIPLLLTLLTVTTATITEEEIDLAAATLRAHGYTLFPNAIATSDLRVLFLSSTNISNFTLFSPPDPLLYSLDFTSPAQYYVHSLLRHVSPTRLPFSLLRSLPYVNTLVPGRRLVVDTDNGDVSRSVLVNGVRVSYPDLFVGSGFVVHGLEGILVNGMEDEMVVVAGGNVPASAPAPGLVGEVVKGGLRRKRERHRHERGHRGRHVNQEHVRFEKWNHHF